MLLTLIMTGGLKGPLSNCSLKLIIGHSIQWPIRSNYIARAKMKAKRGSYTCNNVLNIMLEHKEEASSQTGPSKSTGTVLTAGTFTVFKINYD